MRENREIKVKVVASDLHFFMYILVYESLDGFWLTYILLFATN